MASDPFRILPQSRARLVGGPDTLQTPAAGLAGVRGVSRDLAGDPRRERPAARDAQHRRAVETVAEDLEREVVTGRFPPQPLHPQLREVDLLPPARIRRAPRKSGPPSRFHLPGWITRTWRPSAVTAAARLKSPRNQIFCSSFSGNENAP